MSHAGSRHRDLERIDHALQLAAAELAPFLGSPLASRLKEGGDPVTEADLRVDAVLREALPRAGEGWLSEETADDPARLRCRRVWVVDPIDGTQEMLNGIPEWCVSVGLVEDGRAVAGGICNPAQARTILGAEGLGITLGGAPAGMRARASLRGAEVWASRSEVRRGDWARFEGLGFRIVPTGSVAWKLGCVAAGLADATWTLSPKHEWDVAAGCALVRAGGGAVGDVTGTELAFNRPSPRLKGLAASGVPLFPAVLELLARLP